MSNDSLTNENKCLVQIREKCINILLLYFHGELSYRIIVRYIFCRSIYLHGIYFYKNQKIQEEIFSCTNKHFNMSRAYVVNQRWNNTELYVSQYWDCKKKRFEASRIFFMYLEALESKPFTLYFISYIIFSWIPILPAVFVIYALEQWYRLNLNFFDGIKIYSERQTCVLLFMEIL